MKFQTKLLRFLIQAGGHRGVFGAIGRLVGRYVGWKLYLGPRIIIDNPQEFIQSQVLKYGVYEPAIAHIIHFLALTHPRSLFFDVGANIGIHTLIAAYSGMYVHAFEPVPRLAQRLKQNIRLNHLESCVSVFQIAISNCEGTATLYVATRKDDGSHSLIKGVPAAHVEPISVATTSIDLHLARTGCGVPFLIKIDVEGTEAWVLDGALTTLSSPDRPIVILETGDRLAEKIGESASSVLRRLYKMNYRIFLLNDKIVADKCVSLEIRPEEASSNVANYIAIPEESSDLESILSLRIELPT